VILDLIVLAHLLWVIFLVECCKDILSNKWLALSFFMGKFPLHTHKHWARCIHTHHFSSFSAGNLKGGIFRVSNAENWFCFTFYVSSEIVIVRELVVLPTRNVRERW